MRRLPEARRLPSSSQDRLQIREEIRILPQSRALLFLELPRTMLLKSVLLLVRSALRLLALLSVTSVPWEPSLFLVLSAILGLITLELLLILLMLLFNETSETSSDHSPRSFRDPLARTWVRGLNATACTLLEWAKCRIGSPAAFHSMTCLSAPPESPGGKTAKIPTKRHQCYRTRNACPTGRLFRD